MNTLVIILAIIGICAGAYAVVKGDVQAATDGATASITVDPGSEDVNRTQGSDNITISVPVAPTPLAVTLE